MTPEGRQRLWSIVRVAIAVALLAYLAGSGVIEWPKLRGLLHAWPLTLLALGLLFSGMVLASWRFCLLTEAQQLHVSLGNSVRLTLIGNAANLVLPTVGSDLVRLWFAADGHAGRRTEIATIVLLDRVLGLVGILLLPIVLAPFFPSVVRASPVILWILGVSAAGAAALLAGILVALSRRGLGSAPVQWALRTFPLRGYPRRILDTIHSYRRNGGALASAVGVSVAANLCAAASIVCLQLAMHPGSAAVLGGFLTSLAFVLNNVPITPGGIGFTEAAVASLYGIAGLEGGAETMLGMRLLFLALAPVGVYLYFRGVRSFLTASPAPGTTAGHA
ncbi:MAG: lysylphosphatidylglycerol synthase transmembrane domain-containing protein [Gemmatimonadota bacterium]